MLGIADFLYFSSSGLLGHFRRIFCGIFGAKGGMGFMNDVSRACDLFSSVPDIVRKETCSLQVGCDVSISTTEQRSIF